MVNKAPRTGPEFGQFYESLSNCGFVKRVSDNVDQLIISVQLRENDEVKVIFNPFQTEDDNRSLIFKEKNITSVLYAPTKDSLNGEITSAMKEFKAYVCPACTFLLVINKEGNGTTFELCEIIDDRRSVVLKTTFAEESSVKGFFEEVRERSQHLSFELWLTAPYFENVLPELQQPSPRKSIETMFVSCKHREVLYRDMRMQLENYTRNHCIRFPTKPVVDLLDSLLRTKQKAANNREFKEIGTTDKHFKYNPKQELYPASETAFIIKNRERKNFHPAVFTTTTVLWDSVQKTEAICKTEMRKLYENTTMEETTDSDTSEHFNLERSAAYKLSRMGAPWNTIAKGKLEPHFKIPDIPTEIPKTTFGHSLGDVSDADSSLNNASKNSSISKTVDTHKQVQCVRAANKRKHEDEIEEEQKKRCIGSDISGDNISDTNTSDATNASGDQLSSKSNSKSDSSTSRRRMACENAQHTWIPEWTPNTEIISDTKIYVDLVIFCPNLELCRWLSATLKLVHLDEIILNYKNLKAENRTRDTKIYSFNSAGIKGYISSWWERILGPNESNRKRFRMIQSRICEYLSDGYHGIAITAHQKLIVQGVKANFRAAIFETAKYLEPNFYTYIVQLPLLEEESELFLFALSGLTRIINCSLKYDASFKLSLCFKNNFYRLDVSLIALIPYYILRSLYGERFEEIMKEKKNEFFVERMKNLPRE